MNACQSKQLRPDLHSGWPNQKEHRDKMNRDVDRQAPSFALIEYDPVRLEGIVSKNVS